MLMLRKLRLLFAILCCLALLFSFYGSVFARTNDLSSEIQETQSVNPGFIITPMMMYINWTYTSISIGTYGETTATGVVNGYQGITDRVQIYLYLERYVSGSWQTYNVWYKSFNSYYGSLQGTDVVPHGYYYRVRGSYYAWDGNNSEQVYGYSDTVYY
jgi:hypothetical protein